MAVYPVAMFILGDINFKDSIKRLRIVLPLVLTDMYSFALTALN